MSGIAIAALVILILLVAIILIILLTPITYAIEVNGRSPYKGEVKVNWLWRVLSVHLAYLEGKPLFKQVYLSFKTEISEEPEVCTTKRFSNGNCAETSAIALSETEIIYKSASIIL